MPNAEYLPRHVDPSVADALESFPIVVLDGPRAVGKTTTAEQFTKSEVRLPRDLSLIEFDASSTLSTMEPPVLIDEWQLAGTDLLWTLKELADNDPTPGQFILTGSVEPSTYGPTYPLTGRATRLVMRPMTQAELRGDGDSPPFLGRLLEGAAPVPAVGQESGFALEHLFTTGFPAAREQTDASMFLNGYAALVSQRAGDEGRDASRLLKTLAVLGVLTAQALPDQRIWDSADINKATWKAYDDLLTRVHLSTPLPAYSSNALKRLTSYPKRLLADTALSLALADLTQEDLRSHPTTAGRYVESFVVQQLRPQTDAANGRLFHLRTSGGDHEVDVILEVAGTRFAFEVKAGPRPTADDAKHLVWLHNELGEDLSLSFVVHTGTDTYKVAEHTWAIPASLL